MKKMWKPEKHMKIIKSQTSHPKHPGKKTENKQRKQTAYVFFRVAMPIKLVNGNRCFPSKNRSFSHAGQTLLKGGDTTWVQVTWRTWKTKKPGHFISCRQCRHHPDVIWFVCSSISSLGIRMATMESLHKGTAI